VTLVDLKVPGSGYILWVGVILAIVIVIVIVIGADGAAVLGMYTN